MRVPRSSSRWVTRAAGGMVQRDECTTNIVQTAAIALVYYSSDTESLEQKGGVREMVGVRRSEMKWLKEFYNERRDMLARDGSEGPLPAAAAVLGLKAVLAEYPSPPRKGRLSLFEQAERLGGQDASGWVLYRIVTESAHESPDAVSAHAA